MPPTHIDIIDSDSLNAYAFSSQGHEFIGICAGTITIIHGIFFRFLSDSNLFPHLGDPNLESATLPKLSTNLRSTTTFLTDPIAISQPNDPIRKLYAHWMSRIAMDFILFHEHAHLASGHVGYLKDKYNQPFIAELGAVSSPTQPEPLDFQALEMDADCCSVGNVLAHLQENPPRELAAIVNDELSHIYERLLAVYVVFRVFGFEEFSSSALQLGTHPPPPMRAQMVFATALEIFKKRGLEDDEVAAMIGGMFRKIIGVVEDAFKQACVSRLEGKGLLQAGEPEQSQHVGEILSRWKVTRPTLLPFARSKLAE